MISRTVLAIVLALAAADPAVRETEQFVGSAASSAILLPKPVPASVGRLVVTGSRVRFEPAAGAPVTLES